MTRLSELWQTMMQSSSHILFISIRNEFNLFIELILAEYSTK